MCSILVVWFNVPHHSMQQAYRGMIVNVHGKGAGFALFSQERKPLNAIQQLVAFSSPRPRSLKEGGVICARREGLIAEKILSWQPCKAAGLHEGMQKSRGIWRE